MPIISDPWFYALAIPAFLVNGISKGGFASSAGNPSVPLLALLIPAPQAAAISLPVLCAMDLTGLRRVWGRWSAREMRALIPGALLGILLGAFAFSHIGDAETKLMVGLISVVFVCRALWQKWRRHAPPPAPSNAAKGGFWAAVSGFTSTIAHAGGPPLAVYLYPLRLDRAVLTSTTICFFAFCNYVKLIPYWFLGQLNFTNLLTSLVLLPIAPIGVYLGIWLQTRISDALFYRVVYTMLLVTGVKLVWDGLGL
ncbi:sulfite exporter TauE/SafE family protein [Acetobacteraceae bacterium H6797]|nr:sulfite exporter TauE/SafE family protein [Acetobacteraceae bacterium H6797]